MTYGVTKIKTCYGNTEKGVTIFDSRRFLRKGRSCLSYVSEVGKKDIPGEVKTGAKARRLMSMWSNQETTKRPKQLLFRICGLGVEKGDGLESDDRNMGKDNGGKH